MSTTGKPEVDLVFGGAEVSSIESDEPDCCAPVPAHSAPAADGVAAEVGSEHRDQSGHAAHGYMSDKDRYLARLRRIEGQARGIHRMIDEEKYCIDILTQISALTSALRSVALGLLDDHMRHCVADAARQGGEAADAKFTEASDAIARLLRS